MSELPECPKCRGPSAPDKQSTKLRCLACGHQFRATLEAALDALDVADEITRTDGPVALDDMGATHRRQRARVEAWFERAMRGEW